MYNIKNFFGYYQLKLNDNWLTKNINKEDDNIQIVYMTQMCNINCTTVEPL